MAEKESPAIKLAVSFFKTERGVEPVRRWLKERSPEDRHLIGVGLYELQLTGHIGMPLCEKLTDELWELRVKNDNIRFRIIFTYREEKENHGLILLNGFIKKPRRFQRGRWTWPKEGCLC